MSASASAVGTARCEGFGLAIRSRAAGAGGGCLVSRKFVLGVSSRSYWSFVCPAGQRRVGAGVVSTRTRVVAQQSGTAP